MKNLKKIGYPVLVFLLTSLSFAACSDEWDAHYGLENTGKIDANLIDYIGSRSDLSIFREMLEKTGYDSLLNQSRVYTIWAPTNASLLGNPVLLDTASWKNVVGNHIAAYSHPISLADSMTITMMNGKRLMFNYMDTTATMDEVLVIEKDKATKNGLVQVLNAPLTYRNSLWEHIMLAPGLDSLRSYALSLNQKTFDVDRSFDNKVFIDSFFITTNRMLTQLGNFDLEDSIYTAILPDNAAWIDAYNRISPYFVTKSSDGGAAVQRANTLWSMVNNLFFWGRIKTPITDSVLVSTSWNKLTHPDSLFMNSEKVTLSNGLGYKTNKIYSKSSETWCKEIRIEAESAVNSVKGLRQNMDLYSYSSLGSKFNVSKNSYLFAKATSTSDLSALSVTFPIPNTLSTKYNMYAVFVPTYMTDTTDLRPYKLEFYLTYNVNVATNAATPLPTFTPKLTVPVSITDPKKITKLLIAKDLQFTTTNIISLSGLSKAVQPKDLSSAVTVGLKIRNMAKSTEKNTYNRDMRIDCIILEPVQ